MTPSDVLNWLRAQVSAEADLCLDSRRVQAGDVFFACPGRATDGRHHIQDAVALGAAAVVVHADEADVATDVLHGAGLADTPCLVVAGLTQKLGELAHAWYGRPSEAMSVVAVTGTNGKTSTTQWIAAALRAAGVACGVVGTLGTVTPEGELLPGALTTPDVLSMHRQLALLKHAGATVVAIEASSIGLDQGRLDGVQIEVAAFTNLTHDHLDYHGTIAHYKAAKFTLFKRPGLRRAIVNIDDVAGRELAATVPAERCLTYSLNESETADFRATDIHAGAHGLIFNLLGPEGMAQIVTHVVGRHNISNLLLVAGVLTHLGNAIRRQARVLGTLEPVPGRLQTVAWAPATQPAPLVVVDYAHTPDALASALDALRETAQDRQGRLWCVFGCGGDRDRSKRPVMGRLAVQRADHVVLTSDNPRSEAPLHIQRDIETGMMGRQYDVQPDRAQAILQAVWQADDKDVILVAGKGHETYQETQGRRLPFDDRVWAELALAMRSGVTLQSDTRALQAGQIFLALKGDNFDGHDYLNAAQQAGASAAIVAHPQKDSALHQLVLGDTRATLRKLGQAWRARFSLPLIAVTGSNGKTTTKEMIAAVLRAWLGDEAVLWTHGNLNNDLGVPMTLLRLTDQHRAAVVELGMNHPGEIAVLAEMAMPTVALVNNAQREHQEFLGSVDVVAHENGMVFQSLSSTGIAIFPGDDTYTALWASLADTRRTVTFGPDVEMGVHAADVRQSADGSHFVLYLPDGEQARVRLRIPGQHHVRNALAAAACCYAVGAPLTAIRSGLEAFEPVGGRMQMLELADGTCLIDDTYNANPDSVLAAIDVLAGLPEPRVLVLGDMGEVGEQGPAMHAEVGAYAQQQGISRLLAYGQASQAAVQAYGQGGTWFEDIEALIEQAIQGLPASVLVKGSRGMRMERVVQALKAQSQDKQGGPHVA